jgi:hypothetical protein
VKTNTKNYTRCLKFAAVIAVSLVLLVCIDSAQQASRAAAEGSLGAAQSAGTVAQAFAPFSSFFGDGLFAVPSRRPAKDLNSVTIFGLVQTALGNAILTVSGQDLIVSNIGRGGGDGVQVALPANPTYWAATFNSLSARSYAAGSFIQVQTIGGINGVPNQPIASGTATDLGSEWGITFNFSAVTSGPLLATYSLEGNIVGTEIIQPSTGSTPQWTTEAAIDEQDDDAPCNCDDGTQLPSVTIHGDRANVIVSPTGNTYWFDHLDVSATTLNTGTEITGNTAVNLTASGISSITITAEPYTQDNGGQIMFSTLGEPVTVYPCCSGSAVYGTTKKGGTSSTVANAFMPIVDQTVGQIDVAVGSGSGTNSYTVSIYSDSDGSPGTPIATFSDLTSATKFGTCCGLVTVTGLNGPALTAGTQYWMVVGPASTTSSTLGAWNKNDIGVTGTVSTNSGKAWVNSTGPQTLNAFDVLSVPLDPKRR